MKSTQKENYSLPIAMMFALFFMIAFVTGLPSPMGVIVAKQFGASNFESQLGFFANFIASLLWLWVLLESGFSFFPDS